MRVSAKNCFPTYYNYYTLYNSFFAFVKELDFSSLIENESKMEDKILQRTILEIKADIKELESKIEEKEILSAGVKNKNRKLKYAEDIDLLSDQIDEKYLMLEDKQILMEEHQNRKQNFM